MGKQGLKREVPLLEIIGNPKDGYLAQCRDTMSFRWVHTPEEGIEHFTMMMGFHPVLKQYRDFRIKVWQIDEDDDEIMSPIRDVKNRVGIYA